MGRENERRRWRGGELSVGLHRWFKEVETGDCIAFLRQRFVTLGLGSSTRIHVWMIPFWPIFFSRWSWRWVVLPNKTQEAIRSKRQFGEIC